MTVYKFSELPQWAKKTALVADVIVKQSTADAIDMASRTATGVSRGGTLQRGYVPRADGTLAASLVSTLAGSTAITQGGGDYALVVGSMTAGDTATFMWTAAHAKPVHYGSKGRAGWHWVTETSNAWQSIVSGNVQKAKAIVG